MENGKTRPSAVIKVPRQGQLADQQAGQQIGPRQLSTRQLKYDLKIDKQVENFLDLKQKLVFFLITASVASVGYTLNFAVGQLNSIIGYPLRITFLIVGSIFGLLAAGCALFSLSQELSSYRMHLDIRYKRIPVEQLPIERQKHWDTVKWTAETLRKGAFVLLFLSVIFQAGLFVLFVV